MDDTQESTETLAPDRERVTYLDVDEVRLLDHWCRSLRTAMRGSIPYLVGSALERSDWRDVDVRVIVEDGQFELLTQTIEPLDLNMLLSRWGRRQTGLPIDCQVQPTTEANQHPGPRHPRGLTL